MAGLAAFGLSLVAGGFPALTESLYGQGIGPPLALMLSALTGVVPLSVAELLIAAFLLWQVVSGAMGLRHVYLGQRRLKNALAAGSLRLGRDIGLLVLLFYVLWGFNYARAPLAERLDLPAGTRADAEELSALADEMIKRTNAAYLALYGVPDRGSETTLPWNDGGALQSELDHGWGLITRELELPPHAGVRYGPVKRLLSVWLLERLGLQGFYFPYTGEANVRGQLPALVRPVSMGHEMAHQRGYAPEAEASFLGFMAASRSRHPHARYSAFVFAQRHLLAALGQVDRERAQALAGQRLPGVQRDIEAYVEYLRRIYSPVSEVASRVNDAYLRSNRVEGGVANYGMVTRLLIAYARDRGGTLSPL